MISRDRDTTSLDHLSTLSLESLLAVQQYTFTYTYYTTAPKIYIIDAILTYGHDPDRRRGFRTRRCSAVQFWQSSSTRPTAAESRLWIVSVTDQPGVFATARSLHVLPSSRLRHDTRKAADVSDESPAP